MGTVSELRHSAHVANKTRRGKREKAAGAAQCGLRSNRFSLRWSVARLTPSALAAADTLPSARSSARCRTLRWTSPRARRAGPPRLCAYAPLKRGQAAPSSVREGYKLRPTVRADNQPSRSADDSRGDGDQSDCAFIQIKRPSPASFLSCTVCWGFKYEGS